LAEWLGREVDLVEKSTLEADRNWLRRAEILENYQTLYESRSIVSA
jgi:predicted nucleotidyltransferase